MNILQPFVKIGHRGAAGHEPENTLRSFAKAIELGADMVEFDVRCCAGGTVVVSHDETLFRRAQADVFIDELTLEELSIYDVGLGEHIPSLRQVLDLINRRCMVNIEIKDGAAVKPVAAIIEEYVAAGWSYDEFLVSSFDHLDLWNLKAIQPRIAVGVLVSIVPPGLIDFAKELQAFSINVDASSLNADIVEEAHVRKLRCYVYTVNEPTEIVRFKQMGVEGIFSDFPERL